MATMLSLEQILDRVQDLKMENEEKDEVIRVQQGQVNELESKLKDSEARCGELELKNNELTATSGKADELVEKLCQMLG
jgi:predicted RNase H-like nuclease (RuvC/YqgF family)